MVRHAVLISTDLVRKRLLEQLKEGVVREVVVEKALRRFSVHLSVF